MNEEHSEDGLNFSEMSDDELFEIVNSSFGRYQQKEIDDAENELKSREYNNAWVESNAQVEMGEVHPPVLLANVPGSKLFSVGQITLATYLGAPVGGFLLLAQNHRALGQSAAAWQPLMAGVASTILLLIIAFFLPENFPHKALPAGYAAGMYYYAQQWQEGAINNHLKAGGRKGSWAATIAVGLGSMVILLGLLFAFAITFDIEP